MATKSLDSLYFATLTTDASTGATYGAMTKIAGVITADIKRNGSGTPLYADDGVFAFATGKGETQITLDTAGLTIEQRGALLGHTVAKGVMTIKAGDESPYVGIAFKGLDHNGKNVYVKLLKGKAREFDETMETNGETPKFSTQKIVIDFINREYDGASERVAYESGADFEATTGENWFTTFEPTTTP